MRTLCRYAGGLTGKGTYRPCAHPKPHLTTAVNGVCRKTGECQECKVWVASDGPAREKPKGGAPRGAPPAPLIPLNLLACVYEGAAALPPERKPTTKAYLECEAGKGVVCRCECNSRCDTYIADDPNAVAPTRVTTIDPARLGPSPDGRRFNCSVLDFGGRRLMAFRAGWGGARVRLAELGADLQPVGETAELVLRHPKCAAGQEDPRLFPFDGAAHVAFAGLEWVRGQLVVSQMVARLDESLRAVRIWEPRFSGRTFPMEKNWGFFSIGAVLRCVYTIRPHRVLTLDLRAGTAVQTSQTPGPPADFWAGWELRGGAAPVRVGDEWYSFFHGWKRTPRSSAPGGFWYDYAAGVYTFDANPPFAVKRVCRKPIWVPDMRKAGLNVEPNKAVIYPSGVVRDGERWLVAAGHQDAECVVASFAVADIERVLETV